MNSLYSPEQEHDSCGVGFVAHTSGMRQHWILTMAVESVMHLTHRGALSADGKTGDGAGVVAQIPHRLFKKVLARWDVTLARDSDLGVGMIFLPRRHDTTRRLCQRIVAGTLLRRGLRLFGWREVPIDPRALGERAQKTLPDIQQVLVGRPPGLDDQAFEQLLYLARKEIEAQVRGERIHDFYIPSFSHRTVAYKGMFVALQLPHFYLDLQDSDFETALAVFHQRYSTNTFPNWFLAQPFRMLGHNGEINTLQANRNWMYAREGDLTWQLGCHEVRHLQPVLQPGGSDSMSLDNVLEALVMAGRDVRHALMMLIPEAWDVHHLACLIGYGASAVNPYLALATVSTLAQANPTKGLLPEETVANYKTSLDSGLRKVMSKMGISTISSYHGAQVFEIIGLSEALVERCFVGTASRLGGIGMAEVAADVLARHQKAFATTLRKFPDTGFYRFRKGGEAHAFHPQVVKALHKAVQSGRYEDYQVYAHLVNTREPVAIRDLLRFCSDCAPIPVEEVESVERLVQRFSTQAMSIGALGPEAHSTLAIAMNRLQAKSNTGEGGEDPNWWRPFPNGDTAASKIKQVASGRFGVTPEYLARAEQLEIKMAQGSKPGEGGQLPGHKVAAHIARIRRAVEGIPLISPAPHHDIYSIEDLSQLIYDLKMVNPRAKVCVKLVAKEGVGTIAAGVTKGYADVILISGHDGGTGASPASSIKNAGAPWELGLSETQQVLVLNDLRKRVCLRVDGGMKTGRDVVVAACLGAEEYGFGSASVVAIGCVMARQCHLNTCPVGVATQRPDLRARFAGMPEMALHFFTHVAQEVREILAGLGYRSLDEIIGHTELLQPAPPTAHIKAWQLDLRAILTQVDLSGSLPRRRLQERNDRPDQPLDLQLLADAAAALDHQKPVQLCYPIRNVHRTVGARLCGEIAHRYGDQGLPDGTIEICFAGSAGQSFGAFTINGVRLKLVGEANDYVGKGMGGGEIIILPPATAPFASHQNVIIGNTVLYGATGGALFAAGRAGERFAVRNSGALAVVEGVGDHGCEYMTAGYVVVLGETGRNFGAGMTNGQAYVLDEHGTFPNHINGEMIRLEPLEDTQDIVTLRNVIARHYKVTGSARAAAVLDRWQTFLPLFWKVIPLPAEAIAKTVEVAKQESEMALAASR